MKEKLPTNIFDDIDVDVDKELFTENVEIVDEYELTDNSKVFILFNDYTRNYYYIVQEPDLIYEFEDDEWYKDKIGVSDTVRDYSYLLPLVKQKIESELVNSEELTKDDVHNREVILDIAERYIRRKDGIRTKIINTIFGSPENIVRNIDYFKDEKYFELAESNKWISKLDSKLHSLYDYIDENYPNVLHGDKSVKVQDKVAELWDKVRRVSVNISEKKIKIPDKIVSDLLYYVERDLLKQGRIQPIFDDENIEDLHVNKPNSPAYVSHSKYGRGGSVLTNIAYEEEALNDYCKAAAQQAGKIINNAKPTLDGSLKDGSRIRLNYGREVTVDGSNFTIRFFDEIPLTPIDLIKYKTFSINQMAYFWLCLEHNKSALIAGGTASGKTTTLNALFLFIPQDVKIVSIEDTQEVKSQHLNWAKMITRESSVGDHGDIGMDKLLKGALRQRPTYILVGEVRGKEAKTLFQAMNTGHATMGTIHADNPSSTISRLEDGEIDVPRNLMEALDLICVQRRFNTEGEERRRSIQVQEVDEIEPSKKMKTQKAYEYETRTDSQKSFFKGDDSIILDDIKEERGWSNEELITELENREKVLEYMVENDINDYVDVFNIFQLYLRDNDFILDEIENDTLVENYVTNNTGDKND